MKQKKRAWAWMLTALIVTVPLQADEVGISESIPLLSTRICSYYNEDGTKIATYVDSAIKVHMKKYENITNPTPEQTIQFLNRNKHAMTCGEENKHYMMVSFELGRAYDQLFNVLFFDWLLTEDESLWIDVNAISFSGPPTGKDPETVLDFMDRQLNSRVVDKKKKGEIRSLVETFEEYLGAKRFKDYPLAEQQKIIMDANKDILEAKSRAIRTEGVPAEFGELYKGLSDVLRQRYGITDEMLKLHGNK